MSLFRDSRPPPPRPFYCTEPHVSPGLYQDEQASNYTAAEPYYRLLVSDHPVNRPRMQATRDGDVGCGGMWRGVAQKVDDGARQVVLGA